MVDINIEGLTRVFDTPSGPEVAVDDIDLSIEHGEFFTFVGPSGCGKTTTLRMIAGLETPTSGEIYFDDEVVTDLPPQQRDLAMVFQTVTLYSHMTIYDNIGYGLRVRGEMEDYDEKIREIAEVLQISELLDKKPNQLSGGQQQRVSLGRALVRDPNAILLDEPLSDLDAKLKATLRVVIQRIHEQFDTTIIYVTHDQLEAMTMSDRIALMNDGRPEQVADPETIHDNPANEFVAKFIGQPSMNVLDARVTDGLLTTESGDADGRGIDVRERLEAAGIDTTRDVRFGFRPGDADVSESLDECFMTTEVDVWETIGSEYVVYLIDENDTELVVLTDDAPDQDVLGIEPPRRIYLFDPETGETLTHFDFDESETADLVDRVEPGGQG